MPMIIAINCKIAEALQARAEQYGLRPQSLAYMLLQHSLGLPVVDIEPLDEWEARLDMAATDCGVSPANEAVSRDGLYQ